MGKTKFFLLIFLTSSLLLLASQCSQGYDENPQIEDPKKQFERCKRECDIYKEEGQREQKQYCQEKCKKSYEEQRKQQEEREQRGGTGIIGAVENHHKYPDQAPETKYRQCQRKCQFREEGEERERCKQECLEEYSKKRGGQGESSREEENQEGKRGGNNPYFFEGQRFKFRSRTEAGEFKVLERFSKRSEFLKGIDNYRLAIYEADPNTFLLPLHCDAEVVVFVTRGEGTIAFVHRERRESFNLERGDAMRIPVGSTMYWINRHNSEKLQIFLLIHPINIPGKFEGFFGVGGGQEAQSFYKVFSDELLEAAFNTPRDKLERLFGQQREGVIVRAKPEQIRALSQHAEGSKRFKGKSSGPFNLLKQRPSFHNDYGQFFEASPDDTEQLRDVDVSVAVMNINQGAMVAPYYNSKSTKLALVPLEPCWL